MHLGHGGSRWGCMEVHIGGNGHACWVHGGALWGHGRHSGPCVGGHCGLRVGGHRLAIR